MSRNSPGRLNPRSLVTDLYWTAVEAAQPGKALHAALEHERNTGGLDRPVWIIALGKASEGMTAAAARHLADRGREPAGGIVISPAPSPSPGAHPALIRAKGDHPVPGPNSFSAAEALAQVAASVGAEDEAWILLSGGATSLAAAPVEGISSHDLTGLYELLLGSGMDIVAMNAVRKRFSRWGAGRLAVGLNPAGIRNYVVSDVVGDDVSTVASGPCVPDDLRAADVRRTLEDHDLWARIPAGMRSYLMAVEANPSLETPKSSQPVFSRVHTQVVASNSLALQAAIDRANELGVEARIVSSEVRGEAGQVGREVARRLLSERPRGRPANPACLVWGGETVVTMTSPRTGLGGRCQELALSAAKVLAGAAQGGLRPTLLAAGTDGRDGPTEAAGAVVDSGTWSAVRAAGRDPERDLAQHDSYLALDAARSLLRTGLTGTNVMDVIIGLVPHDSGQY